MIFGPCVSILSFFREWRFEEAMSRFVMALLPTRLWVAVVDGLKIPEAATEEPR
jgi:hypothetical protein